MFSGELVGVMVIYCGLRVIRYDRGCTSLCKCVFLALILAFEIILLCTEGVCSVGYLWGWNCIIGRVGCGIKVVDIF